MPDMFPRKTLLVRIVSHRIKDLGSDDDLVPPRPEILQRPPQDLLTYSDRVHVSRIEEVDPQLQRPPYERPALFLLQHPLPPFLRPVRHGTETNPRHLQPGRSQIGIVHP